MINTKVNPEVDNHLLSGNNLTTGEGMIAVILEDGTSENLYRNSALDTAALAAWCTKVDDVYTLVATSPIDEVLSVGDIVKNEDGSADYGTIYKILKIETSYIELISQNIPEHVFVECSSLTAEQLAELEKLTEMHASEIIERLYEAECEKYCKLTFDPEIAKLDLTNPNPMVVAWEDEDLKRKVTNFTYSVKMTNADGTMSSLPAIVITNKTIDGCTLTVPSTYTEGFANIKVTFYFDADGNKYQVSTKTILTNWEDPVICVDSLALYDQLKGYGMMVSPAVADPTHFADAHDISAEEMNNAPALEIMLKKGWVTATAAKKTYLMNFGMSEADATALSTRFMLLSEAVGRTSAQFGTTFKETTGTDIDGNTISYNAAASTIADPTAIDYSTDHVVQLKHFEAFGYFIGVTSINANAFRDCRQLHTIYLPITITTILDNAFYCCYELINLQTLED